MVCLLATFSRTQQFFETLAGHQKTAYPIFPSHSIKSWLVQNRNCWWLFHGFKSMLCSEQDTPLYINPNKHVLCKRSQFNVKGMVNTQHTQKQISKLSTKRPGKFCQQINLKIFFLLGALREKKGLAHAYRTPGTPKRQKTWWLDGR